MYPADRCSARHVLFHLGPAKGLCRVAHEWTRGSGGLRARCVPGGAVQPVTDLARSPGTCRQIIYPKDSGLRTRYATGREQEAACLLR